MSRSPSRPRTGAWIETWQVASGDADVKSRPRTGAWIETPWIMDAKPKYAGRAHARARGLKLDYPTVVPDKG